MPLALRVFAALAALTALAVLWSSEKAKISHDLQLISEPWAKPGEILAVRALLLADVEAPQGPTLARTPIALRLSDAQGRELARTRLVETATDTMEGTIRIPDTLRGLAWLEARAQWGDGPELRTRRPLHVEPDAPSLGLRARAAGALQQLAVGSARSLSAEPAPTPFLPRVLGGACLPEESCTLLVWVGEPAASVRARESAQVSVPRAPVPPHDTAGLVELQLVPHGPEAEVTLEARRAGLLVAERNLRLPIALGEVAVHLASPLAREGEPLALSLSLPPGRSEAIVDVFAADRWRASRAYAPLETGAKIALEPALLPRGMVRIQARVDRFSGEGAGSRVAFVRGLGEDDAAVLRQIAGRTHERLRSAEPTDPWAAQLPGFALDDPQRSAAFLLAPLERWRAPIPEAVSGRPAQLARLQRTKALLRFGVSGVMVLAALTVGVSLMRRGLSAADEASAILDAARGSIGDTLPERRRARLGVVLMVLAVSLAFVAGALLIVAKPLWF